MPATGAFARYARQLVLPEVGARGQERLARARVMIVGAGGLGSPAALYLAAAGAGEIALLDDDTVELSNLHRQVLHRTADVGRHKTASGADALRRLNGEIRVSEVRVRLQAANARELFAGYDVVIDGSDNYPTRYAVNDACTSLRIPWVYGSVERFAGQVSVFDVQRGPCYRCLFPEAPAPGSTASCEDIGVLGAVPGVIGTLQAVEALKVLLEVGQPLVGRLMQLDLLSAAVHVIEFGRRPDCPACGDRRDSRSAVGDPDTSDITPAEVAAKLDSHDVLLLDVRERWEVALAHVAGATVMPMNELASQLDGLPRDRDIVVLCHHGARSGMVSEWLRAQGYRARNVAGGIDRWSREVDPAVPRY